jgi:pimeloyl-ACP methyl ester carboxylesterase
MSFVNLLKIALDQQTYANCTAKYAFNKRDYKNGYTIYSHKTKRNKRSVLFLSGGAQLSFASNLTRICDQLLTIDNSFNCYVFENKEQYNLLCIDQIVEFCKTLPNVTIVGLSNGGFIGSHVASRITNCDKLICVNSAVDIYHSAQKFYDGQWFYRPDIFEYYYKTFLHAQTHTNNSIPIYELFQLTTMDNYVDFLTRHYGITRERYKELVCMQYPNCEMHLIHGLYDPIIDLHTNLAAYDKQDKKSFAPIHHFQDEVTHCMSTGPEFISRMYSIINSKPRRNRYTNKRTSN